MGRPILLLGLCALAGCSSSSHEGPPAFGSTSSVSTLPTFAVGLWSVQTVYKSDAENASDRLSRGVTNMLHPVLDIRNDGTYRFQCNQTELTGRWFAEGRSIHLELDRTSRLSPVTAMPPSRDFEVSPVLVRDEAEQLTRLQVGEDPSTLVAVREGANDPQPHSRQMDHKILHRIPARR